jgi:DNA modification methylase
MPRPAQPLDLKPKDLIGVPWRVALALQADGWYLRQDIIWSKPNPMPESVLDRCTKAHEYLFLLSKSERYHYDALAIREPASDTGRQNGRDGRDEDDRARPPGSNPRTLARLDYTQPRKIKVPGGWDRGPGAHGTIHRDGRTSAEYQEVEVAGGRNKRSVWEIATSPFPEAHFATFPPALIEPCIKAGCPACGTVLDPFGGAGTTGLVTDRLQRNAILIELNPAYAAMAERRIRDEGGMLTDVRIETPQQEPVVTDDPLSPHSAIVIQNP